MGELLSLFWAVDPPPRPLTFSIPSQDHECWQDDSCGAVGTLLFWYFVIILVLMFFSRAPFWMSEEKKKDEDSETSTSVSKASKDTSRKWQNQDGAWDSPQKMKKPKQIQLTPITDSEVALVNAYLKRRRSMHHSQFSQVNQTQHDSDTTEYDSEESDSGASSWKESENEHPSPTSIKRKTVQRQKSVTNSIWAVLLHMRQLEAGEEEELKSLE
ncbi:hypothetical protein MDA_GLEAN10013069 [Myotis davidii]|uniref:Serine-rich single-pass membrane protein 1 n=1 Tax=Myotis davidii TaxID=225400 RepID=L5LEZ3_MYODS|nr:hypothetical protein MDA_GLEAN10013069 [Myotis davidii]